jgi:hypothetical protein
VQRICCLDRSSAREGSCRPPVSRAHGFAAFTTQGRGNCARPGVRVPFSVDDRMRDGVRCCADNQFAGVGQQTDLCKDKVPGNSATPGSESTLLWALRPAGSSRCPRMRSTAAGSSVFWAVLGRRSRCASSSERRSPSRASTSSGSSSRKRSPEKYAWQGAAPLDQHQSGDRVQRLREFWRDFPGPPKYQAVNSSLTFALTFKAARKNRPQ